jgi:hypothetical protein
MRRAAWMDPKLGCLFLLLALGADKKTAPKPSNEALKEYNAAVALLNSPEQQDKGIQKLIELANKYPDDPVAQKARDLLLDYGVGKEARVVLIDRKMFRDKLKILDKDILAMVEAAIRELEPRYKAVTPFFKQRKLKVVFYDGEARYRTAGGMLNASGHFKTAAADYKARALEGSIEWYLPKQLVSMKDRQTRMKGILYHEATHYLNAASFGGALPQVFEEGIATYLESRLNTEYYQNYRQTDRERIEANARNALNSITKLDDFMSLLQASRGFGQGGEMISRWYGLCYAIVDFFEEGKVSGRKASFEEFFSKLESLADSAAKEAKPGDRPRTLEPTATLSAIVASLYSAKIEDFHKALLEQVVARYKQR